MQMFRIAVGSCSAAAITASQICLAEEPTTVKVNPVSAARKQSVNDGMLQPINTAPDNSPAHLIGAVLYFRHGSRVPLHVLPIGKTEWPESMLHSPTEEHATIKLVGLNGEPWNGSFLDNRHLSLVLPGGAGSGQLTKQGMQDALILGKRIKQRYSSIIGPVFDENVFVRTTNMRRTVETARGVLTGMFGSNKEPITILTDLNHKTEFLYPNPYSCKLLKEIYHNVSTRWKLEGHGRPMIDTIANIFNVDKSEPKWWEQIPVVQLHNDIAARRAHDKMVPPELTPSMLTEVSVLAPHLMTRMVEGSGLRLTVGELFNDLNTRISNLPNTSSSQKGTPRLHLMSCHDSSLIMVLAGLGHSQIAWPQYCSLLEFQIFESEKGNRYVRVLHDSAPQLNACGLKADSQGLYSAKEFQARLSQVAYSAADRAHACNL
eukprot:m.125935 g.125935  ORF g.125935 m.125935 type:complete len:432 (-) comp14505_c1_seq5:1143-2438(-)